MRATTKLLVVFGLIILLRHVAAGQSMMETATAAAGGSIAGAAGKSVSDGIDGLFRKIGQHTATAAGTPAPAATPAAAGAAVPLAAGSSAPAGVAAVRIRKPGLGKRVLHPMPPEEPAVSVQAPPAPPEFPSLTATQLERIPAGASREDVLAKLGNPSARISIPEDGRLLEIFQYSAKGEVLGAVRLTDGLVSTVRINVP